MSDGTLLEGEEASAVYDLAILLAGWYHVIEWIRTTLLLTVICIGVNLISVWYLTSIITLYGIGVFAYIHYVYFALAEGKACAEAQPTRHMWLMIEIIYFWAVFLSCQCPMFLLRLYKKERLHEIMKNESETNSD